MVNDTLFFRQEPSLMTYDRQLHYIGKIKDDTCSTGDWAKVVKVIIVRTKDNTSQTSAQQPQQ